MRYERWAKQYLDIRRHSGAEVEALCPFHEDHRPSFYFNLKRGMWICHACGVRGNYRQLVKLLAVDAFEEDVEELLQELRKKIEFIDDDPGDVEPQTYPDSWLIQFEHDHHYFSTRGLSDRVIAMFGLGYDVVTNSVTFPLRDIDGKLHGVLRRQLSSGAVPKYLEPTGYKKSDYLYGAWLVTAEHIALTEGQVDALAMWDAGIQAVAMGGSSLSRKQAQAMRELAPRRVTILPDNDLPGRQAVSRAKEMLTGMQVYVGSYDSDWGKDPAELTRDQRVRMYQTAVPYHRWMGHHLV